MNGVMIGRFRPLHLGHQATINRMLSDCGAGNSLIIIGSANSKISVRNIFGYDQCRQLIRTVYPDIRICGLGDFGNNRIWTMALQDILEVAGFKTSNTLFFGGCIEDTAVIAEKGWNRVIVDRFQGPVCRVSATEIRDCLIRGLPINGMVDDRLVDIIGSMFIQNWSAFSKS